MDRPCRKSEGDKDSFIVAHLEVFTVDCKNATNFDWNELLEDRIELCGLELLAKAYNEK